MLWVLCVYVFLVPTRRTTTIHESFVNRLTYGCKPVKTILVFIDPKIGNARAHPVRPPLTEAIHCLALLTLNKLFYSSSWTCSPFTVRTSSVGKTRSVTPSASTTALSKSHGLRTSPAKDPSGPYTQTPETCSKTAVT